MADGAHQEMAYTDPYVINTMDGPSNEINMVSHQELFQKIQAKFRKVIYGRAKHFYRKEVRRGETNESTIEDVVDLVLHIMMHTSPTPNASVLSNIEKGKDQLDNPPQGSKSERRGLMSQVVIRQSIHHEMSQYIKDAALRDTGNEDTGYEAMFRVLLDILNAGPPKSHSDTPRGSGIPESPVGDSAHSLWIHSLNTMESIYIEAEGYFSEEVIDGKINLPILAGLIRRTVKTIIYTPMTPVTPHGTSLQDSHDEDQCGWIWRELE